MNFSRNRVASEVSRTIGHDIILHTSIYDNLWWTLINSVRDAHLCQADVTTLYVVFISTILSFQNKRCLVTTTVFSCLFSFVAQNYICLFLTIFGWHLEINYLLVQSSQYSIRILTEHQRPEISSECVFVIAFDVQSDGSCTTTAIVRQYRYLSLLLSLASIQAQY